MSLKRLLAVFAVLAIFGCTGNGPAYPDSGEDDSQNKPGDDGNPTQGSLTVDPPVTWV